MSNEKKNQHIISKTVLKGFAKSRELINNDLKSLGDRYLCSSKESLKELAEMSCYQILKKDFDEKNDFFVRKSNLIGVGGKKLCEDHLYSVNVIDYQSYLNKFGLTDTSETNKIRYLLEDDFCTLEHKFGNFIKKWNDNEINFMNLKPYLTELIDFVQSNELRGKHIYRNLAKKNIDFNLIDYSIFDKAIFCTFTELFVDDIFNNIDYYEQVELMNYLYSLGLLENNDLMKKLLAKFNNKAHSSSKDILLIQNNTSLSFLLSDISTSIFYDNFKLFDEILDIIGIENFSRKPKKISIMPIRSDLIAIVSDVDFKSSYVVNSNILTVKKINSLLCSQVNEWLIISDVSKLKKDIVDEKLLKRISRTNRFSNCLYWYDQAFTYDSFSNSKFGYLKINLTTYLKIKPIIVFLNTLHRATKELNIKSASYAHLDKKEIRVYYKENGFLVAKIDDDVNALIVKEKSIYKEFENLTKTQILCLQQAFYREKLSNYFIIDKSGKQIVFYKSKFLCK